MSLGSGEAAMLADLVEALLTGIGRTPGRKSFIERLQLRAVEVLPGEVINGGKKGLGDALNQFEDLMQSSGVAMGLETAAKPAFLQAALARRGQGDLAREVSRAARGRHFAAHPKVGLKTRVLEALKVDEMRADGAQDLDNLENMREADDEQVGVAGLDSCGVSAVVPGLCDTLGDGNGAILAVKMVFALCVVLAVCPSLPL